PIPMYSMASTKRRPRNGLRTSQNQLWPNMMTWSPSVLMKRVTGEMALPNAPARVRSGRASSLTVVPGHPLRDAAHDLVVDHAGALRQLGGGDLLAALAAEEHDLVADAGEVAERGDVDHEHVHADGADDGAAAAAHEDLARGAGDRRAQA